LVQPLIAARIVETGYSNDKRLHQGWIWHCPLVSNNYSWLPVIKELLLMILITKFYQMQQQSCIWLLLSKLLNMTGVLSYPIFIAP
jgi:hypothetical protein